MELLAYSVKIFTFGFEKLICILSTYTMRVIAYLSGVHLGKSNKFYGIMTFHRHLGSSIKIGSDTIFRSKYNSNLIGINRPCIISTNTDFAKITIGNQCGFSGTVIGAFSSIEIHDNVRCGANTLITDSDWHNTDLRVGPPSPIVIGKNVWLGEDVKILKGVTIGENSVIGSGSIVTKDIPKNVIAAGNPCKIIRIIEE